MPLANLATPEASVLYPEYFLGLKWQHRRSSHTIDGVSLDAEYLADHIAARYAERAAMARADRSATRLLGIRPKPVAV